MITSDEALELSVPPKSALIVGAGAIRVEFSSFFRALGIPVILVEMRSQILPDADADASNELAKVIKRQGVQLRLSSSVQSITSVPDGLLVSVQGESRTEQFTVSHVLVVPGAICGRMRPVCQNQVWL